MRENISNNTPEPTKTSTIVIGRPTKIFVGCAPRTKRQRIKHLIHSSSEELSMAVGI